MIIKKFTGKTEAEATEAAKKELGNGLVIMNVREVKKKGLFSFLSPKQIEVTAALEDESPQRSVVNSLNRTEASGAGVGTAKTVSMKNSTENIEKKLDSLQTLLESQLNSRPVDANTEKAAEAQKEALDSEAEAAVEKQEEKEDEQNPEQDKFIRLLYNKMLDNEMDEKYVNSILEDASKTKKADLPFDYLLANIYQKMVLKESLRRRTDRESYGSSDLPVWVRRLPSPNWQENIVWKTRKRWLSLRQIPIVLRQRSSCGPMPIFWRHLSA